MKEPTEQQNKEVRNLVDEVIDKCGFKKTEFMDVCPFLYSISVPLKYDAQSVADACTEIFSKIGLIADGERLVMDSESDFWQMYRQENNGVYDIMFNHPLAKEIENGSEESRYILKNIMEEILQGQAEEEKMEALVAGIKAGRLKSKSPDGYLVLAGEFYDAIEAGKKKVEYRDFTENNLKRTIGIKTIRFNRGYGSKGKPPKQMRWEVKRVTLVDEENDECNPMKVSEDFWPTTIAIHLGKRIG